ncbi:Extracellular ligand-binding receptor [Thermogladius calderae 1633]|uniref:Extracellular ligand-binding receptor n=1 Tax=Thermogladius calderae (strain DSM 22663 / VKM B-2946 / 1633) TaxID=1184251 RepID=I3TEP8_THEC1|nr:penicillin-binding protein activator [Thermogladius calderae]AFK51236.1 Extracellular ligand-binding receptor [Thermogladius calderae 1633]
MSNWLKSTPASLAFLLIGLVLGFPLGYVASTIISPQSTSAPQTGQVREYRIGVTLPLSGELSSIGKIWEKVVYLAFDDLNEEVKTYGFNVNFKPVILDDGTQDDKALANVQSFAQMGIKVVIGPAASSQVKAVKSFADANHIVIISPSSTAPTLAIPNDFIFRTVGSDAKQAKALATLAYTQGARTVVVFHRNDEYGNAFAEFFTRYFSQFNNTKVYDLPYQTGLSDYTSEVNALASKVQSTGADSVVLIAFDTDAANILAHAAGNSVLSSVRWFLSEGPHGAQELLSPTIGQFAQKVRLLGTRPLFVHNPLYDEFAKKLKEKYGVEPTVFCDTLYDAIQLAGWAILRAGKYDGDAIRASLVEVAKHYYGPSGWTMFDENGDKAFQDYGVWAIVKTDQGYQFMDVGVVQGDSVIFTTTPYR